MSHQLKVESFYFMGVFKSQARDSLVAQRVKNLPGMREIWVWSLGWEDLLEEEMAAWESWEVRPWPLCSFCCCLSFYREGVRSAGWAGSEKEDLMTWSSWVSQPKRQKYLWGWVARSLDSVPFLGEKDEALWQCEQCLALFFLSFFNQKICLDLPGGKKST